MEYIENGRLESIMCVHQTLPLSGDKWYRNFWNVGSSFWRANSVKNTSFWAVCQVQKLCDLYWRCSTHGTFIDKVNERVVWVKQLLGNSILTTFEVLEISFGSFQRILKYNLNMFHVAARFIPCLQSEEHTLVCVHVNLWLKAKWLLYHILPAHQI